MSTFLIATVQPYKKTYMNVVDILVLSNLSLISAMFSLFFIRSDFPTSFPFSLRQLSFMMLIFASLPIIGLAVYIAVKTILWIRKMRMWNKTAPAPPESSKTMAAQNSDTPELNQSSQECVATTSDGSDSEQHVDKHS